MMELPSTPTGVLRMMPTKASEIGRFAAGVINNVKNGEANALEVLVMLRALEALSETIRDSIKENILTAADKYSEKTFEVFGARIEKGDVGVKYLYETSGDWQWESFKTQEQTAANLRKDREAFLRSLKEPITIVDEESGEVSTIKPPLKRSTSGLKVFLK